MVAQVKISSRAAARSTAHRFSRLKIDFMRRDMIPFLPDMHPYLMEFTRHETDYTDDGCTAAPDRLLGERRRLARRGCRPRADGGGRLCRRGDHLHCR